MKRLLAFLISFSMLFSFSLPVSASQEGVVDGGDPVAAIKAAREADPEGFDQKVALLQQSEALMTLFHGAPNAETVRFYLEFFAMQSTLDQVKSFVANTEGKHFEVSGTMDNHSVKLKEGPEPKSSHATKDCCACWQAWVASAAYMVGTGMLCTAVGVAGTAVSGGVGAVSGFVCGGVFWGIDQFPDWDAACR